MRRVFAVLPCLLVLLLGASSARAGMFVIGDQNATPGQTVTFWGAQWWKDNALTQGQAPASFKGWASDVGPPCTTWTTEPGNSSDPPPTVDPFIVVLVSDRITKSGPTISGDQVSTVLVRVNPGYAPDPGHPGTGTVLGPVPPCGGFIH